MFSSVLFVVVAVLVAGSQQMPQIPLASGATATTNHQASSQTAIKLQTHEYKKPATYQSGIHADATHQAEHTKTGPSVVLPSGVVSRDQRPIVKPAEPTKTSSSVHVEATSNKKAREATNEEFKSHEATQTAALHPEAHHVAAAPVAAVQKDAPKSTIAKVDEHHDHEHHAEKDAKTATKVATNEHHVKTRDVNQELAYIIASPIDDPTLLAFNPESSIARDRRIKVLPAFLG